MRIQVITDEGLSLDVVVVWRGERVGVEVDGPTHFVPGASARRGLSSPDAIVRSPAFVPTFVPRAATAAAAASTTAAPTTQRPNGNTRLKRRQLRRFGWRTVAIAYFEWTAVEGCPQARRSFLEQALDRAVG